MYVWEIDNFVIQSDIFRRFFICKNILKKLLCYHDNYFKYFTFGKYNGFVGGGFCMHVFSSYNLLHPLYLGVESHVTARCQGLSRLPNDKKGKALGTRLACK